MRKKYVPARHCGRGTLRLAVSPTGVRDDHRVPLQTESIRDGPPSLAPGARRDEHRRRRTSDKKPDTARP